jgi:dGTPase
MPRRLDFVRYGCSHSPLEVAQVGRESGNRRLRSDVVETACLAHDLGHPPFGHTGEQALTVPRPGSAGSRATRRARLLTRLEAKTGWPDGRVPAQLTRPA